MKNYIVIKKETTLNDKYQLVETGVFSVYTRYSADTYKGITKTKSDTANYLTIEIPSEYDGDFYEPSSLDPLIWIINTELKNNKINLIKAERDFRLIEVDRMASKRYYGGMSDLEWEQWKSYRQHLLDVPSQSLFPTTVDWGTKPV